MRPSRCLALLFVALLHSPVIVAAQTTPSDPPPASAPPPSPGPPPAEPAPPPVPSVPEPGSSLQVSPPVGPSHAERRIEELEKRLRLLEEKSAGAHDASHDSKAMEKPAEKQGGQGVAVAYGPEGVAIASADGKFQYHFRPNLQADARFFLNDGTNTFLLRRVRPTMEGTLFEFFDWRIMPELTGTPRVLDAYANIRLFREIQLRAGKFKSPVGYERLLNAFDLPFLERGMPDNLVPNRDIGLQIHGDVLGGTLIYALGVFNGANDGTSINADNNDKKDVAARIMLHPLTPTFIEPLRKLGVGFAATRGTHTGDLPTYRTPVGTTFFQYSDGVTAGGTSRRIAPQLSYYFGPFGMFAEYVRSTQIVVAPALSQRLNHQAWQVVGSFFITGEEASEGTVTPKKHLDPRRGGFGAIEVVARIGQLAIDGNAFDVGVADKTVSARRATDWSVGANWHLARNFKWMWNYEHTSFVAGAQGGDRTTEIVILSRFQAAY
ncbi:MAG: porin [Polyangiaceae bacterium]